jgi:hypothetical protein
VEQEGENRGSKGLSPESLADGEHLLRGRTVLGEVKRENFVPPREVELVLFVCVKDDRNNATI